MASEPTEQEEGASPGVSLRPEARAALPGSASHRTVAMPVYAHSSILQDRKWQRRVDHADARASTVIVGTPD